MLEKRIEKFGLRIRPGVDFDVVNPEWDERYRTYWQEYLRLMDRKGITEQLAKIEMRRRLTLIGAMMVRLGDADGMICGTYGSYGLHLPYIDQVIGMREGVGVYGAMNTLVLTNRQVTLVDTHVNYDPSADQLAQITILAAEELRRVGVVPKAALLSHSNFGSSNHPSALKMREVLALLRERAPDQVHVPAYLGKRGWIGLWLETNKVDASAVEFALREAYLLAAPKALGRSIYISNA